MAINFPATPSVNDTYTLGNRTWQYNGTGWVFLPGGIPSNVISVAAATGVVSNAQLIAGILTVDGTGSNLDADLLDGQQGTFYTDAGNLSSGTLNSARLPTSGVAAATYGNATNIPVITVDTYGRITSASNVAVVGGVSSVGGATGAVSNAQLASGITSSGLLTTANVTELTNLYFTNARVSVAVSGQTLTNTTFSANVNAANALFTSNVNVGNLRATTSITSVANIFGGTIIATANVNAANANFTSNVNVGNLIALSSITSVANIFGSTIIATANVNAANANFTSNVSTGNITATTGTFTNSRLGTVQTGTWQGTSITTTYTDAKVTSVANQTGAISNVQLASGVSQTGIFTTANVTELTNLYFTNARVYSNVVQIGYATIAQVAVKANVVDLTTANVTELTNLYFTNARVYSNVVSAGFYDTVSNTAPIGATESGTTLSLSHLNSGVSAATYGNATIIPVFTVNATGHITSASNVAISFPASSGGGGGAFNTAVNRNVGYDITTSPASAFSAPSTAGIEYIIHSVHVTNIGTVPAQVTGSFDGTTYSSNISFANTIPVPTGTSVELLKRPKVLQPSDVIYLSSNVASTLNAVITYETQTSTAYFGSGIDITSAATYTTLYTATANSMIESILLTNDDASVLDVKARVVWTNAADVIQGYYAFDLIIPNDATVEILEQPKYLENGHKIRVYANQANRLEAIIAGKAA